MTISSSGSETMNKTKCRGNGCEYAEPATKREVIPPTTSEETEYGKPWAEMEMPKILGEKERKE
jgi:hypothetical protein